MRKKKEKRNLRKRRFDEIEKSLRRVFTNEKARALSVTKEGGI